MGPRSRVDEGEGVGEGKGEVRKRTSVFCHRPAVYSIRCDKCKGSNIQWSEFKGMIWCYKCKVDTKGTGGIFDGPIPIQLCDIMGLRFDRISLKTKKVSRYNLETGKFGPWETLEVDRGKE